MVLGGLSHDETTHDNPVDWSNPERHLDRLYELSAGHYMDVVNRHPCFHPSWGRQAFAESVRSIRQVMEW